MVRNPIVRTLSAYRNKIEKPFDINHHDTFPEDIKQHILHLYRREEFYYWLQSDYSSDIYPKFGEYVRWLSEYPRCLYNEHFKPVIEMCFPCAVSYDFYANFKSYDYDVYALMHYLDIPMTYYPRVLAHPGHPTSKFLEKYYGQLSEEERNSLHERLKLELEFYYTLYPEERGMNVCL